MVLFDIMAAYRACSQSIREQEPIKRK